MRNRASLGEIEKWFTTPFICNDHTEHEGEDLIILGEEEKKNSLTVIQKFEVNKSVWGLLGSSLHLIKYSIIGKLHLITKKLN